MSRMKAQLIDAAVVASFARGDSAAVSLVVLSFGKRLAGYVRFFTRNQEISKEIAQETLVEAYRKREDFRRPEELTAWLFTVAKRKAIRVIEKKSFQRETAVEPEALADLAPAEAPRQIEHIQLQQLTGQLLAALDKLDPEEKEVVSLRYFGNLQIEEISRATQIPMGTVGGKLNRALLKVRKTLESVGIRPEDVAL